MKKIKPFGVGLLVTICCVLTSVASTSNSITARATSTAKCICTDQYKPVCIIATGQQFPNSCHAACAGYSPKEWTDCSMM